MATKRSFKLYGKVADVPEESVDYFIKKYPDAVEVKTFLVDQDTADVPLDKVDYFTKKYANAKPLFEDEPTKDFTKEISNVEPFDMAASIEGEPPPANMELGIPPPTKQSRVIDQSIPEDKQAQLYSGLNENDQIAVTKAFSKMDENLVGNRKALEVFFNSYAKSRDLDPKQVREFGKRAAAQRMLDIGDEAFNSGDKAKAEQLYLSQVGNRGKDSLLKLSELYKAEGRDDEAAQLLEQANQIEFNKLPQVGTGSYKQPTYQPTTLGASGKQGFTVEGDTKEITPDTEETQSSKYLNDIADAVERLTPGKAQVEMIESGINKTIKGATNLDYYSIGNPKNVSAALNLVVGLGETALGTILGATPSGAANFMPFEVATTYLPEDVSGWLMPVSKGISEYYDGKYQEEAQNVGFILDTALFGALHMAAKGVKGKIDAKKFDLGKLDPEAIQEGIKAAEERLKQYGGNTIEYKEAVARDAKNTLEGFKEISTIAEGKAEINPTEPIRANNLLEIPEGTNVEFTTKNGKESGVIDRLDDGTWIFENENGTTEIPVKDKTNPVETLQELGIDIVPDVAPEQVAKAMADAERVGWVEDKGKRYFVSLGNPMIEGSYDLVFEQNSKGGLTSRFDSHSDPTFAEGRKLKLINKLLEQEGLPSRDKVNQPPVKGEVKSIKESKPIEVVKDEVVEPVKVENILNISTEEANVLSMLHESRILTPTEKKNLYRQYKRGVMSEKDISKYTNVNVADLQNGDTKWAQVILDKTKGKKIEAEDVYFEDIPNEKNTEQPTIEQQPVAEKIVEAEQPTIESTPTEPVSEVKVVEEVKPTSDNESIITKEVSVDSEGTPTLHNSETRSTVSNVFNENSKEVSSKINQLKDKINKQIKEDIKKFGSKKEEEGYIYGTQSEKIIEVPNYPRLFESEKSNGYWEAAKFRQNVNSIQRLNEVNNLINRKGEYNFKEIDSADLKDRLGSIVFSFNKNDAWSMRHYTEAFEANEIVKELNKRGENISFDKLETVYELAGADKSQMNQMRENVLSIQDLIDKKNTRPKAELPKEASKPIQELPKEETVVEETVKPKSENVVVEEPVSGSVGKEVEFKHAGQDRVGTIVGEEGNNYVIESKVGNRKNTYTYPKDKAKVIEPLTPEEQLQSRRNLTTIANNNGLAFSVPSNLPEKAIKFFKKMFNNTSQLPKEVFGFKVAMQGENAAKMTDIKWTVNKFNKTVQKVYNQKLAKVPASEFVKMDKYLKGDKSVVIDPEIKTVLDDMRDQIDNLSRELINLGLVDGDLSIKISQNEGVYVTRTYRVFDDPKWAENVPEDIKNRAKAFLRSEFPNATPAEIDGIINSLLFERDAPMQLLSQGKVGKMDLSILSKRKEIPLEIRQLLGEYNDPVVNYAKSVYKINSLIANSKFLKDVYNEGLNKFLFENKTGDYFVPIAASSNKSYSPLSGLYTTPELAEAFSQVKAVMKGDDLWNTAFRSYMTVNAAVKAGKTIGSIQTHVRNVVSNINFLIANGNILQPKNSVKAWDTVKSVWKDSGVEQQKEYIKKLQRLGILDDGANAMEMLETIKDASSKYDDVDAYLNNNILSKIKKGAVKAYALEDAMFKVFSFESEKAKYEKAGLTPEQAEVKAAEIVRKTMPTYSLTPEIVKQLRKFPLMGTFVSFPAEVIRTYANTWQLAIKEMKDPVTKNIGIQRATGLIIATALTKGISEYSKYLWNVSTDEEKALRRMQPPWSKNSDYVIVGRDKNNVPIYVDLGYSDPYNYLKNPINSIMFADNPKEGAAKGFYELLKPFISEEMLAARLRDVSNNHKSTGGDIYNEQEPLGDQLSKIYQYMADVAEPGTITSIRRIYKGYKGETSNYGKQYDVDSEIIAMMSGQRVNKTNVLSNFSFKSKSFNDAMTEGKSIYNTAFYNKPDKESVDYSYDVANDVREKLYNEFKKDYKAAVKLEADKKALDEAMKTNRISRAMRKSISEDQPYNKFLEKEE